MNPRLLIQVTFEKYVDKGDDIELHWIGDLDDRSIILCVDKIDDAIVWYKRTIVKESRRWCNVDHLGLVCLIAYCCRFQQERNERNRSGTQLQAKERYTEVKANVFVEYTHTGSESAPRTSSKLGQRRALRVTGQDQIFALRNTIRINLIFKVWCVEVSIIIAFTHRTCFRGIRLARQVQLDESSNVLKDIHNALHREGWDQTRDFGAFDRLCATKGDDTLVVVDSHGDCIKIIATLVIGFVGFKSIRVLEEVDAVCQTHGLLNQFPVGLGDGIAGADQA